MKKFPIVFKPLKYLKICLYDLPWAVVGELSFLRRSFRRLQGSDLLVVPGSGPLYRLVDDGFLGAPLFVSRVGPSSPE